MNTDPIYYFGSMYEVPLTIPNELVGAGGPGPFDEAAAYFGPLLAELNPGADLDTLRKEVDEYGIEPEKYADDDDLWQYVSWFIATNLRDEEQPAIDWEGIEWFQDEDGTWAWWACQPGCLPDGDQCGPFDTPTECIEDIADTMGRCG